MVARYAEQIGRALDLTYDEMKDLIFAARVHDVGKILIPERILNKSDVLTEDEFYLLKMHATLGGEIVGTIPGGARIQAMVRHHHEQFSGGGYPDSMIGENIPVGARIIAVAEAFANMTMDRPYASRRELSQAIAELERVAGTQLDPKLVALFVETMRSERSAAAHAD
jgi:HD-GYP domain-containing protein (c-di-GMP phosphodiesterase class II)